MRRPVSSYTSRMTASVNDSPGSTCPPGNAMPGQNELRRFCISTRPASSQTIHKFAKIARSLVGNFPTPFPTPTRNGSAQLLQFSAPRATVSVTAAEPRLLRLADDPINLRQLLGRQLPPQHARRLGDLPRPASAPQSDGLAGLIQHPPHRQLRQRLAQAFGV